MLMTRDDTLDRLALATARLLSSETRLRLLLLLQRQGQQHPLCVNALARRLGVSQAAVSQHLRRFQELGLLVARETGSRTHYYLDREALDGCREALVGVLSHPADGLPADGEQ